MAHSTVVKNFRDGTLSIADGAGSPATHTVAFEAGDFSISGLTSETSSKQYELATYMDRGDLQSIRRTTQTFVSGSFTMHLVDLSDGSYSTAMDLMLKRGSHASAVSTLGATADVYAVKLTLTVEESDHSGDADHTIILDDCVCSVDVAEGDPGSISISFTSYGVVEVT